MNKPKPLPRGKPLCVVFTQEACKHAFEELPDGTALCFECDKRLTKKTWKKYCKKKASEAMIAT